MAGITLERAEAKLKLWLDAEDKVASGQAWSDGTRQLTRADLNAIREQITFWEGKVDKLTSRTRIKRISNIT